MGSTRFLTSRAISVFTVVFFGLSLVLGCLGIHEYTRMPPLPGEAASAFASASPYDTVYYTLQLFVLGSEPLAGPGPFPIPLEIARFLAPLTTVLAVLQGFALLFDGWLTARAVRRKRGHTIVVGDGRAAAMLAERLVTGDRTVAVLGNPSLLTGARGRRLLMVPGDPSAERTLTAAGIERTSRVFAVSESWLTNAAVALAVSKFAGTEARVYADVQDDVMVAALRARHPVGPPSERRPIDVVSLSAIAARALLDRHEPGYAADGSAQPTVVVGTGLFARTLLGELARAQRLAGITRKVTVVTNQDRALEVMAGQLTGLEVTSARPAASLPDATMTFICLNDPDQVLRTGLGLGPASRGHVVLCLQRLAGLGEALNGQRVFDSAGISVFGILDAACDPDRLVGDLHDRLGRAIHAGYVRDQVAGGATAGGNVVPWERLTEPVREENRAAAVDIERKLESIDAVLMPIGPVLPAFAFTDVEVDQLAQAEHARWAAAKVRAGVTPQADPDVRHWDVIGVASQSKDKAMIRGLPQVLAEAGLQIVRRCSL